MEYAAGGGTAWEKTTNRLQADLLPMLYGVGTKPLLSLYNNVVPSQSEKMFGWRAPEVNTLYNPFTGKNANVFNPYENWRGGFNKEKATADFKQRSDLANPQMMAEMLRLVGQSFSTQAQQPVKESLQAAHPESFKQANQLLSQQTNDLVQSMLGLKNPIDGMQQSFLTLPRSALQVEQSLLFLPPPVDQNQQAFFSLIQPTETMTGNFGGMNNAAIPLPGAFTNATTGANNLAASFFSTAARISNLEIKAPSVTSYPVGAPVNQPGGQTPPGRAMGGGVSKGHSFLVGERGAELFVPAVSGSIVTNDSLRRINKARENLHGERRQSALNLPAGFLPEKKSRENNLLNPTFFASFGVQKPQAENQFPTALRFKDKSKQADELNSELNNTTETTTVSRRGGSQAVSVNINFNPRISISGRSDSQSIEQLNNVLRESEARLMAKLRSLIDDEMQPDNVARRVAFAAERDSERT